MKPIDLTNDEEYLGSSDDSNLRVRRYSRLPQSDKVNYVKTMMVADVSVQDFHGSATTMYIATMMNLVSVKQIVRTNMMMKAFLFCFIDLMTLMNQQPGTGMKSNEG